MKLKRSQFWFLRIITFLIPLSVILSYDKHDYSIIIVMIAVALIVFNSFSRQYLPSEGKWQVFIKLSIIAEIVLATIISYLANNGITILYYLPAIFEANVAFSLSFSIPIAASSLLAVVSVWAVENSFDSFSQFITEAMVSAGITILFTFIMSYSLKIQIDAKQKAERANLELEQAYKKLLDNAAKMQELSIEKERIRMAREIHDTLAHSLTASIVQMEAAKKLIDIDQEKAREELEKAQNVTREGLNDVKRSIKALRPQKLENDSFKEAIMNLIGDLTNNSGTEFEFSNNISDEVKIPSSTEVVLFRVIQESITNSIRHGKAKKIRIALGCENGIINVNIEDNGIGCSSIKKGFGLQGINERIESISGTVGFHAAPDNGFKTNIYIPFGAKK